MRVDFLRLSHGEGPNREIENLGHLIHLCGETVLHVGDAMPEARSFEPYRLAEREIDVALLPFWFWLERGGPELVAGFDAGREAACHVPPVEVSRWKEVLGEKTPGVQVMGRSGEALSR